MLTLLLLLLGSCALCLFVTPAVSRLALRCGLVDKPDGRRKIHGRATPVAGGLALLVSGTAALSAAFFIPGPLQDELTSNTFPLVGLLAAALTIAAVGVADDYGCLRGRHKVLGQILAILIVVQFGLVVRTVHLFGWQLDLGLAAVPFTVLWLLGAINSLNLIDGMDGLLTSVGLIVCLAIAGMAVLGDKWVAACVAVTLAGALLGFLRWNFPPASIFLGDSGSMLIGLVVGTLAIQGSLKGPATIALAAPTALLTIPFFDTLAAIIRRKLTGRSIYATDRGHLHHCLLRRGCSSRRVLLLVSTFCLITVGGALASLALEQEVFAILAAALVISILIVTQMFGHAEFLLLKKHVVSFTLSFLRLRKGEPRQTEVRLQGSADWKGLWDSLIASAVRLNFKSVCLNVNAPALHEGYHARWECAHGAAEEDNLFWRAEIPLTVQGTLLGRLEILGEKDYEPVWRRIAAVLQLVEEFERAALLLVGGTLEHGRALSLHGTANGKANGATNGTAKTSSERRDLCHTPPFGPPTGGCGKGPATRQTWPQD